jgi:hypothetical protein
MIRSSQDNLSGNLTVAGSGHEKLRSPPARTLRRHGKDGRGRISARAVDASFLSEERWGATSLHAVGGVWAVVTALAAAILTVVAVNWARLPSLRATMDAGANASVLPALSVASLVGFGAVVAAMKAFAVVRDWVLGIGGAPLVSLATATNVLAALTGSASGGFAVLTSGWRRNAASIRHCCTASP